MNQLEKLLASRPDLERILAAKEERLLLGNFCDTCNTDFDGNPSRMVVLTSPPVRDELPKLEVRLECNPSCDGADGFLEL